MTIILFTVLITLSSSTQKPQPPLGDGKNAFKRRAKSVTPTQPIAPTQPRNPQTSFNRLRKYSTSKSSKESFSSTSTQGISGCLSCDEESGPRSSVEKSETSASVELD